MAFEDWSDSAGGNTSIGSINWAEGQAPSTVNNSARQLMADVAAWFKGSNTSTTLPGPEWIDDGNTHTYVAATQYKVAGKDVTVNHHVGRKVRAVGP